MGKKMKLPFLFKTPEAPSSPSWPWPSCGTSKTLSFRASNGGGPCDMFKAINSAFKDGVAHTTPDYSWFSTSSAEKVQNRIFSAKLEESSTSATANDCGEVVEAVIRGLRSSERLFFEPGETSSIMEEVKNGGGLSLKESRSVVVAMESLDPQVDFKRSMEEMVEAHGIKDWESLEELLSWYLMFNAKNNHGYIIGAFVDLLAQCCSTYNAISDCSPISPISFSSSSSSTSSTCTPCLSSSFEEVEDAIEKNHR